MGAAEAIGKNPLAAGRFVPEIARDRETFDHLVRASSDYKADQLWGWGESRRLLGWEPMRYVLPRSEGDPVPVSLETRKLPIGGRLALMTVPRPLPNRDAVQSLSRSLLDIGKAIGAIAVTLVADFPGSEHPGLADEMAAAGMVPSSLVRPRMRTIIVELSNDADTLFQSMSYGTRRDARKAMRSGVSVRRADDEGSMATFCELYAEMCAQKGLPGFPLAFFQRIWKELVLPGDLRLFLAEHDGRPIGGTIVACEPHGYLMAFSAHRRERPDVGASRLLEWEIIRDAKSRNLRYYDLGGIPFESADDGVRVQQEGKGQVFWKAGFGGTLTDSVGSFDLVVNPVMYSMLRLFRAGELYQKLKRLTGKRWL